MAKDHNVTTLVQNGQRELLKQICGFSFPSAGFGSNGAFSISSWHPFAAPYKWIHSHSARLRPARIKLLSEERRADKSPSYSRQHAVHFNYHTFPSRSACPRLSGRERRCGHTLHLNADTVRHLYPLTTWRHTCLKAKRSEFLSTLRSGWVLMQRRIAYCKPLITNKGRGNVSSVHNVFLMLCWGRDKHLCWIGKSGIKPIQVAYDVFSCLWWVCEFLAEAVVPEHGLDIVIWRM